MHVFLTGGTGLLGSHLADELVREGHRVTALHRRSADTAFLDLLGVRRVEGDVTDAAPTLARAMEGCTHVVHAAALVYAGGSWPKVRAVNVDGTRHVLTAAAMAGVGHAVHVSSVAVYGGAPGPVDETTPIDTPLAAEDLYAQSKREAEAEARAIEGERGLPVTVVRPSAVYGERDRLMVPAIVGFVRSPVVPLLGDGTNALPVVYAGNVAVALRLALEAGRGAETFDLGLDHPLTQRDLFAGLARGTVGRVPRFVRVPAGWILGGAGVLSRMGVRPPGAAHLSLDRVARLALEENPFPSRRARRVLGWEPPYRHDEALVRTGRWWAAHRSRTGGHR